MQYPTAPRTNRREAKIVIGKHLSEWQLLKDIGGRSKNLNRIKTNVLSGFTTCD